MKKRWDNKDSTPIDDVFEFQKENIFNEFYTVFCDIELPALDISVRVYYEDGSWNESPESQQNYTSLEEASRKALEAKKLSPKADVKILHCESETKFKYLEV